MKKKPARVARPRVRLIQSEDRQPVVKLTAGKRYEVVATSVVDSDMRPVGSISRRPPKRPPRLCGSRGTCVAIVEID